MRAHISLSPEAEWWARPATGGGIESLLGHPGRGSTPAPRLPPKVMATSSLEMLIKANRRWFPPSTLPGELNARRALPPLTPCASKVLWNACGQRDSVSPGCVTCYEAESLGAEDGSGEKGWAHWLRDCRCQPWAGRQALSTLHTPSIQCFKIFGLRYFFVWIDKDERVYTSQEQCLNGTCLMPSPIFSTWLVLIHYILIQTALWGGHHHSCFVDEATEAQRG